MGIFKRSPRVTVSITEDGVSVENSNEDFALTMVSFWAQTFNQDKDKDPGKKPLGFSNDHVTEVESDTERLPTPAEPDDDEDDDD